ncbi:uncharacterized protein BROUX77_000012 [Berkeleyomyces rouxiae]|uniref:uncharacterized protein n=1 Tax=Berkeleyomyces rouxiae TaxID=2035830 RepID=UPI003B78B747
MKIGCLQLSPGKGELNSNISRVDAVLQKGIPDQLDLLVLPELAFSGTGFKSSCEALPHVESTASGISPIWAKAMALKHDCTVVIGYPERERSQLGRESVALYNSLAVVNNDGELLSNYRAVHLQPGDEYWAQESRTGFHSEWIPGFGQMVLGLSMDIKRALRCSQFSG